MYPVAAGTRNIAATSMRYVPALYSGKLLVKFYARSVVAAISNTDYEGEIKEQGDTVYIRTVPDITIRDHTKGQALVHEQPTSTPTSLLIDQGKYWAFATNKVDDKQTDIKKYTEKWTDDASKQLKIAIDTDILGTVYASAHASNQGATAGAISGNINLGVTGTPVGLDSTNVLSYIVSAGQVLDEQNVPEEGRWMVIPAWMCSLIKLSDLKDASLAGDATSILRNGRLGMIDTFTLYKSNLLSTTTDGANTCTNIIFGTNHAITFASQLTENENLRNPFGFGTLFRGLQVYGFEEIKPEALGWLYAYKA